MYACILESGRGFFEGVCAPSYATAYSSDPPPPPSHSRILNASTPSPKILAIADIYSLPHYLVARNEFQGENRPFSNPYWAELSSISYMDFGEFTCYDVG